MRWLFLLLLILNLLYAGWHLQQAPMGAGEIAPLALRKAGQQDIRLLSETSLGPRKDVPADCLYVGGYGRPELLAAVQQRLDSLQVSTTSIAVKAGQGGGYWLRIAPANRAILDETALRNLSRDINDVKHKIMPCEGIATAP
jgi:hypothetical protein